MCVLKQLTNFKTAYVQFYQAASSLAASALVDMLGELLLVLVKSCLLNGRLSVVLSYQGSDVTFVVACPKLDAFVDNLTLLSSYQINSELVGGLVVCC